ncbi:MAG: hypothetical protein HYY30_01620 [Chloroflexi bacterium]|nr:hypothetical protein [Chloroflexota bacterium]
MASSTLFRLSGWATIVAGALTAVAWVLLYFYPTSLALNALNLIGLVLSPLAITGLYLRQREESGALGAVGYVVGMIAIGLVTGLVYTNTFALSSLSESQQRDLLAGVTGAAFGASGIVMLVGMILFGAATFRAGVFPRVPAVVLVIGSVPLSLVPLFPPVAISAGAVLFGVALIWLGYRLSWERSQRTAFASGHAT